MVILWSDLPWLLGILLIISCCPLRLGVLVMPMPLCRSDGLFGFPLLKGSSPVDERAALSASATTLSASADLLLGVEGLGLGPGLT